MILFHDLSSNVGYAYGSPGGEPVHGSFAVGGPGCGIGIFLLSYRRALLKQIDNVAPDVFVFEAPFFGDKTSGPTGRKLIGIASVAEMTAFERRVPVIREVSNQTVCRFFTGRGRWSGPQQRIKRHQAAVDRQAKKAMTIRVCRGLGWMPRDDDAADALAGWAWACSILAPEIPPRHWQGELLGPSARVMG